METIEVFYKLIGPGYYHKYIVYTAADGSQYYARGGPATGPGASSADSDWLASNDGVFFGNIVTEHGLYTADTIDWDVEGDDPSELIVSGDDLSAEWSLITAAIENINAAEYLYDPFSQNSNSTVDSALVAAGLMQPELDNIFPLTDYWSPGSGVILGVADNTFTEFDGEAGELLDFIVAASQGLEYVQDSVQFTGDTSALSIFGNLNLGTAVLNSGVLITSGDGTPPDSNTESGYGTSLGLPGDDQLTEIVNAVFAGDPNTFDANRLDFQINVTNESIQSIAFDIVFASEEFPEFVDDFVDIAAIIVNGVNIAYFDGDTSRPLSVLSANNASFQDNTAGAFSIEYDAVSATFTVIAEVQQGINSISIAIADTGDSIYDSALFVSNMRALGFDANGVLVQVDAGAAIDDDNELVGTDQSEYFVAGAGDDVVDGGAGNDILDLGVGNDQGLGGAGSDQILGGEGNDSLLGGAQNDLIMGGEGDDTILGELGADTLHGGDGNDLVLGGNRNDQLYGDQGEDKLFAGNGDDMVEGGTEKDIIRGGNQDDLLLGQEGDDVIFGGTGRDNIQGGEGDDTIFGRGGFDVIEGGAGDDILTGGLQADTYLFSDGFGNDIITDFAATNNAERIDLSAVTEIEDFADLVDNHLTQDGLGALISDGLGNTITLLDVNISDLDSADFLFS